MSLTGTMQILDAPPEPFFKPRPDDDPEPKRCAEQGCARAPLTTPTGRVGKYCEEHKNASDRTGSHVAKGPRKATWKQAAEIEDALNKFVAFAGIGLQVINKTDGRIIAQGGPNVVHELVDLARTDLKLRRYLEMAATPGRYGPLVIALSGVVIPIMANHDLLPKIFIDLSSDSDTE